MTPEDYEHLRELYHELAERPLDEVLRELDSRGLAPPLRTELEALLRAEPRLSAFEGSRLGRVGRWLLVPYLRKRRTANPRR